MNRLRRFGGRGRFAFRDVAQMVARLVRDQEAVGSTPAIPTSLKARRYAVFRVPTGFLLFLICVLFSAVLDTQPGICYTEYISRKEKQHFMCVIRTRK